MCCRSCRNMTLTQAQNLPLNLIPVLRIYKLRQLQLRLQSATRQAQIQAKWAVTSRWTRISRPGSLHRVRSHLKKFNSLINESQAVRFKAVPTTVRIGPSLIPMMLLLARLLLLLSSQMAAKAKPQMSSTMMWLPQTFLQSILNQLKPQLTKTRQLIRPM